MGDNLEWRNEYRESSLPLLEKANNFLVTFSLKKNAKKKTQNNKIGDITGLKAFW